MAEPRLIDTLIRNAYVVTMDAGRRVFTDGWVAFDGGRIVGVGGQADCPFQGRDAIDARGRMLLPGIANAHNHLVQNAFRGYNDDRWPVLDIPAAVVALLKQLQAFTARIDEERAFILTRAHMLDLLRSGYTATHDEHFTNIRKDSVDGSWAAVEASGLRGFLCRCIVNAERIDPEGRETAEAGLIEADRLRTRFASDRIEVAAGFLNFQFLNDPEDMRRIAEGTAAIDMRLDIDMTDNSRGAVLKARGFDGGQVEYYQRFGILDRPLYAGKAVSILPHEYKLLAQADARVGLVPMLRFFDGTGLDIHEFLKNGILPAIGTDAPLVSDSQSPFEAMRLSILAQNIAVKRLRAAGGDAPDREHWAVAETMLEMATLGGARALFMEDETGALEVGKAADCVMVDLDNALSGPSADTRRDVGALVWAGSAVNVHSVFVAGRRLLDDGRSTLFDEEQVMREANTVMTALIAEAGLDGVLPPRVAGRTFRGWNYH